MADCDDRCYPFVLTLEHLAGSKFSVELHDVRSNEKRGLKGEIRVEYDKVVSLGLGFEPGVKGHLIWFDRAE